MPKRPNDRRQLTCATGGPIKPDSVLCRALEMIAAEVAKCLDAAESACDPPERNRLIWFPRRNNVPLAPLL